MFWSGAVPAISKHTHDQKLRYNQANDLLSIICRETAALDESQLSDIGVYRALYRAVRYGNVELLCKIFKYNPRTIWCDDHEDGVGIFLYATLNRQEKIFGLLYQMEGKKNLLINRRDEFGNNILHQAAKLAPSNQPGRLFGAALQMQRELQWFKVSCPIMHVHFEYSSFQNPEIIIWLIIIEVTFRRYGPNGIWILTVEGTKL